MNKNDFYKKWLQCFAEGITPQAINKYVVSTGNYIWHIFSWGLISDYKYLTGNSAKIAYNNVSKQRALCIEWFIDDETKSLTDELGTADALDKKTEIYVVSPDFTWTYIKTHESMCGPYFMKL